MKNKIYFVVILFGLQLAACAGKKEKSAAEMLKDPVKEGEVYDAILADNKHLMKLMDRMMADKNCRRMMTGKGAMMKMMCMSESMDSMMNEDKEMAGKMTGRLLETMKKDSMLCDHTCSGMMENERVRRYMKKHSH